MNLKILLALSTFTNGWASSVQRGVIIPSPIRLQKTTPILRIPVELSLEIFKYLDIKSLSKMQFTCKYFGGIIGPELHKLALNGPGIREHLFDSEGSLSAWESNDDYETAFLHAMFFGKRIELEDCPKCAFEDSSKIFTISRYSTSLEGVQEYLQFMQQYIEHPLLYSVMKHIHIRALQTNFDFGGFKNLEASLSYYDEHINIRLDLKYCSAFWDFPHNIQQDDILVKLLSRVRTIRVDSYKIPSVAYLEKFFHVTSYCTGIEKVNVGTRDTEFGPRTGTHFGTGQANFQGFNTDIVLMSLKTLTLQSFNPNLLAKLIRAPSLVHVHIDNKFAVKLNILFTKTRSLITFTAPIAGGTP
jgi:hypothetical protein